MLKRTSWRVAVRVVMSFAARAVLPVLLLTLLALLSGVARTTALGAFGLVLVLKGVMSGLDRLAESAPTPRYRMAVSH